MSADDIADDEPAAGDPFDRVYRYYRPRLWRRAMLKTGGDEQDATDVVDQALFDVYTRLRQGDFVGPPGPLVGSRFKFWSLNKGTELGLRKKVELTGENSSDVAVNARPIDGWSVEPDGVPERALISRQNVQSFIEAIRDYIPRDDLLVLPFIANDMPARYAARALKMETKEFYTAKHLALKRAGEALLVRQLLTPAERCADLLSSLAARGLNPRQPSTKLRAAVVRHAASCRPCRGASDAAVVRRSAEWQFVATALAALAGLGRWFLPRRGADAGPGTAANMAGHDVTGSAPDPVASSAPCPPTVRHSVHSPVGDPLRDISSRFVNATRVTKIAVLGTGATVTAAVALPLLLAPPVHRTPGPDVQVAPAIHSAQPAPTGTVTASASTSPANTGGTATSPAPPTPGSGGGPRGGAGSIAYPAVRDLNYVYVESTTSFRLYRATGPTDTGLSRPLGVSGWQPSWSHDRHTLVYLNHGTAPDGAIRTQLFIAHFDDSGSVVGSPHQLLATDAVPSAPQVSPEGTSVAYAADLNGNTDIYRVTFQPETAGAPQRLTTDPAFDTHPTWSPAGDQIAFSSNRNQHDEIWVMAADGSAQHDITQDGDWYEGEPAWGADNTIAYISTRSPTDSLTHTQIFVCQPDGSGQHAITPPTSGTSAPVWSMDGSKVLYQAGSNTTAHIYAVNHHPGAADNGQVTQLTTDTGPQFSPTA